MSELEERKDKYPHLLFNKYIGAGKVMSLVGILLSVIIMALLIVSDSKNLDSGASSHASFLNLVVFVALLIIFNNYLLNFGLTKIRTAVKILIFVSICIVFINDFIYAIINADQESEYNFIDLASTLLVSAIRIACWGCYIYIGVVLCRYKGDFVGGLHSTGIACIMVVITGILLNIASSFLYVLPDLSYLSFYKISSFINGIIFIYLLYNFYRIFFRAQQYNLNQLKNNYEI